MRGALATTCTKPHESPANCALCNSNHLANYKGRTVYKELQKLCRHPTSSKHSHTKHQQQSQYLLPSLRVYQQVLCAKQTHMIDSTVI